MMEARLPLSSRAQLAAILYHKLKTITTRPEGLLNPYWKACFVPSVELKSKFPFLFSSCGGSLRNDRQASADRGGSTDM